MRGRGKNPSLAAKGRRESDQAVGAGSLAGGRAWGAGAAAAGRGTSKPVSTRGVSAVPKARSGWLCHRQLVGRGRSRSRGTAISPPSLATHQRPGADKVCAGGVRCCGRWARGALRGAHALPTKPTSARAAPRRQESVNPAVFEVESGSLSSLRLPGNCQPCREMAVLFWKLALVPLQLLEMNLLFPQLQISTSSIAASAPSAAPAQRAHCSSLAH